MVMETARSTEWETRNSEREIERNGEIMEGKKME
jgi:hypothetical protein